MSRLARKTHHSGGGNVASLFDGLSRSYFQGDSEEGIAASRSSSGRSRQDLQNDPARRAASSAAQQWPRVDLAGADRQHEFDPDLDSRNSGGSIELRFDGSAAAFLRTSTNRKARSI